MSTTLLSPEEWWRDMLEIRGIAEHDVCAKCHGYGVRGYGDTTTWRGGIGGQQLTSDVCDRCWGSGDSTHPWPSHREFRDLRRTADAGAVQYASQKARADRMSERIDDLLDEQAKQNGVRVLTDRAPKKKRK